MQIPRTQTQFDLARMTGPLSRMLARIVALDAAYRGRQRLAEATPEQLRDMGISPEDARASCAGSSRRGSVEKALSRSQRISAAQLD